MVVKLRQAQAYTKLKLCCLVRKGTKLNTIQFSMFCNCSSIGTNHVGMS